MNTSPNLQQVPPNKRTVLFHEIFSTVFWMLVLVKLFVIDYDVYLIRHFAPDYEWLLSLKLVFLLAVLSGAALLVSQKSFFSFLAYVISYPLLLSFWRLPKLLFRHWPTVVAFAPAIYLSLRRFRSTFALYTLVLVCATLVSFYDSGPSLTFAMFGLLVFLPVHLFRRFREAFGVSLFRDLTRLVKGLKDSGLTSLFGDVLAETEPKESSAQPEQVTAVPAPDKLMAVYMLQSVADIVSSRVNQAIRSKKYDLYLVFAWFYTVVLTVLIYAFEYWALNKLDTGAFSGAQGAGFWSFFHMSVAILTTAGGSSIQATSPVANVLSATELLCIPLILTIFIFTLLTTARETYRQDADDFRIALHELVVAFEMQLVVVYALSAAELERRVVKHNELIVKWLRRAKGLTDLPDSANEGLTEPTSAIAQPKSNDGVSAS